MRRIGHEKLIGRDLLVAVVASHGEYARDVYLPAGRWADYHSNEWFDERGRGARRRAGLPRRALPPAGLRPRRRHPPEDARGRGHARRLRPPRPRRPADATSWSCGSIADAAAVELHPLRGRRRDARLRAGRPAPLPSPHHGHPAAGRRRAPPPSPSSPPSTSAAPAPSPAPPRAAPSSSSSSSTAPRRPRCALDGEAAARAARRCGLRRGRERLAQRRAQPRSSPRPRRGTSTARPPLRLRAGAGRADRLGRLRLRPGLHHSPAPASTSPAACPPSARGTQPAPCASIRASTGTTSPTRRPATTAPGPRPRSGPAWSTRCRPAPVRVEVPAPARGWQRHRRLAARRQQRPRHSRLGLRRPRLRLLLIELRPGAQRRRPRHLLTREQTTKRLKSRYNPKKLHRISTFLNACAAGNSTERRFRCRTAAGRRRRGSAGRPGSGSGSGSRGMRPRIARWKAA